ncbi:MAG: ABC transporter permease subunit [Lachnospiraceae bacterium]|nr:ABC transporter permease subunit [Lachnospiraceae bacterium]
MTAIIKYNIKRMISNPLFWVLTILAGVAIFVSMWKYCSSFGYLKEDVSIIDSPHLENRGEVTDGYIPRSDKEINEQLMDQYESLADIMVNYLGYPEKETYETMEYLKNSQLSLVKQNKYLDKKYHTKEISFYYLSRMKKSTVQETNQYMKSMLHKHSYTYYVSFKYAGQAATYICLLCIIVFIFSFYSETKKDVYELLHTKPFAKGTYVMGKIISNLLVGLIPLGIITLAYDVVLVLHANREHLPFHIWDIWLAVFLLVVPVIFFFSALYMLISLIFMNSIPAVAISIALFYSSAMGFPDDNVTRFSYLLHPFGLVAYFPYSIFFGQYSYKLVLNFFGVFFLGVVLCVFSEILWQKRRAVK